MKTNPDVAANQQLGDSFLDMQRMLTIGVFLTALIAMTVLNTVIWQRFVTDTLYNCTDPGWLDYLFPGSWVHNSVVEVQVVVNGRSMSEPDTIRKGWSVAGLWCLWFSFVVVSLVVSGWFARMLWIPSKQPEQLQRHTEAV